MADRTQVLGRWWRRCNTCERYKQEDLENFYMRRDGVLEVQCKPCRRARKYMSVATSEPIQIPRAIAEGPATPGPLSYWVQPTLEEIA